MDLPSLDNRVGGLGCAPNVAEKRDAPLFGCFRNLHSTMSRAAAIGLPPFFFRLQPSAVNRCVLAPRIFLIEGFHRSGGGCGLEFPGRLGLDPKRRYGPGLFVLGSGSRHGGRDNEVSLKQKKKLGAALENGKDQSFSSCPSISITNSQCSPVDRTSMGTDRMDGGHFQRHFASLPISAVAVSGLSFSCPGAEQGA